jgi:hypothetical protein
MEIMLITIIFDINYGCSNKYVYDLVKWFEK